MIRLIQVALLAAMLSGCVSSRRSADLELLVGRWKNCTITSYVSQRKGGVERNLAAEQAFFACRTEEEAIAAQFATDADMYLSALRIIATQKATMKSQLLAAG